MYETMNEDQKNWNEMAKTMMKIDTKPEEMFNTIHIKDQPYGEVSRSFVVRWKDQLEQTWHLLDNLVNPTILVGWTKLGDFYGLTGNHQVTMTHFGQSVFFLTIFKSNYELKAYPKWHSLYYQISNSDIFKVLLNEYKVTCSSLVNVSSIMYSFMKGARFTHLNLKGITECKIVYNHWRKFVKIGYGWRTFTQSQNFEVRSQIQFEFLDATSNFVLFWICFSEDISININIEPSLQVSPHLPSELVDFPKITCRFKTRANTSSTINVFGACLTSLVLTNELSFLHQG
ncbi:hypothetical protein HKD37_11G031908 [Glycine soja]